MAAIRRHAGALAMALWLGSGAAEAERELPPRAWLGGQELESATLGPDNVLDGASGRRVWPYRAPFRHVAD